MLTNEHLAEYLKIQSDLKRLEDRKEELRALIIENASFSTEAYRIKVTESESERIESLKAIRDKSEKLYNALIAAGSVYKSKSVRVTVSEVK